MQATNLGFRLKTNRYNGLFNKLFRKSRMAVIFLQVMRACFRSEFQLFSGQTSSQEFLFATASSTSFIFVGCSLRFGCCNTCTGKSQNRKYSIRHDRWLAMAGSVSRRGKRSDEQEVWKGSGC